MAVYHANMLSNLTGPAGLTTVRKGRHAISAPDVRSEGELMACASGRIRNRAPLMRELGLYDGAADAEIVIVAYRRWNAGYPAHIEGPVNTVLIDRSNERMIVSRDRMGERRLFYCRKGRTVAVSDHPDPLIASPYASRVVDLVGLNELFALGPARTPGRTPYRDVMELEPGCFLIAERSGLKISRYYSMEAFEWQDSPEAAAENVRGMLETAVDDIIPFADSAMLSGGLDSTVLTALMHEKGHAPHTFSVDYTGDEFDFTGNAFQPERDGEYAAQAAELFSADHTVIELSHSQLSGALREAMDARGFPGMADIDSSLLLFVRSISARAGNIVSGECGDEVFCGYPWFRKEFMEDMEAFPWSGSMDLRRSVLRKDVAELLKPERYAREVFVSAMETAPRLPGENLEDARLRALQWVCFRFFMANLQERALCMCERSSVNVYTPFCDERLAEYVWNAPGDIKFLDGENKGLLRAAVSDLLPENLLRRKKSPYPKVYSLEYTGDVKNMIIDILEDGSAPILQLLDPKRLRKMSGEALPADGLPWFGQLMSGPQMLAYLWQINEWMRSRKVELSV